MYGRDPRAQLEHTHFTPTNPVRRNMLLRRIPSLTSDLSGHPGILSYELFPVTLLWRVSCVPILCSIWTSECVGNSASRFLAESWHNEWGTFDRHVCTFNNVRSLRQA